MQYALAGRNMFDYSEVDRIVDTIAQKFRPRQIILFGSTARHDAKDDSDIDLLVIFDHIDDRRTIYRQIFQHFDVIRIPIDLLITTTDNFNQCKDEESTLAYEIAKTGKIVYAA